MLAKNSYVYSEWNKLQPWKKRSLKWCLYVTELVFERTYDPQAPGSLRLIRLKHNIIHQRLSYPLIISDESVREWLSKNSRQRRH